MLSKYDRLRELLNPFAGIIRHFGKLIYTIRYYRAYHIWCNLKNPSLFHDKLTWLSYNTDTTRWSQLADKYNVRRYVADNCGEQYLNDIYGVYDSPEAINFDELPEQFVLKMTNGCAMNMIVRDKSQIDYAKAVSRMKFWMKFRFGDLTSQPHYSAIKPRILAEKLLVQDGNPKSGLIDYKFNAFNGYIDSIDVYSQRIEGTHLFSSMIYDSDWNPHPEWLDAAKVRYAEVPKPECFEQMKKIASRLSTGFPYVRVDLYCIDGKPLFGEMTFTPGFAYHTLECQKRFGDLIVLPQKGSVL